jgi:HTH-type transcriptional regulator, transcriptional repressor of NAD biosynthesis genes
MEKKYKRGLVFGKFMPFHKGHEFLIQTAANQCVEVFVLVCSVPTEPIAGELRYAAVKRTFPNLNVLHVTDKNPSYPNEHKFFWQIWLDTFQRNAPNCDAVFSSETYGDEVAARLNIAHICVDKLRKTFSVSGTNLRENLTEFWDYLPAASRVFMCPRVALLGAESVGKSTLSQKLAAYFNTIFVPGYGREYVEKFGQNLSALDLSHIAAGQLYYEDEAATQANRILFCDTELLTTQIWSEIYCGLCPDWIIHQNHLRKYQLFLLLDSDIKWVDDGTRLYENIRKQQTARILAELESRNLPYVLIKGDFETREKLAIESVKSYFPFLKLN